MSQSEDAENKQGLLVSPWLAFYSGTFLLGGLYLFYLLLIGKNSYPIPTAILGCAALSTGLLLFLRKRAALWIYVAIAIGLMIYSVYRYATDGYNSSRVAIAVGGLLMLVGYSSVAEELPAHDHKKTQQ